MDIKLIYTIKRKNGYVFHSPPFTIQQIESGEFEQWKKGNSVWDEETIFRRVATGLTDKHGKELYYNSDKVKLPTDPDGFWVATRDDFGIPIWIRNNNVMDAQMSFEVYFLNNPERKRNDFEIIGTIHDTPTQKG